MTEINDPEWIRIMKASLYWIKNKWWNFYDLATKMINQIISFSPLLIIVILILVLILGV